MKKTQTTKDGSGKDSIMVRTDLTIRDLMKEKPSSRWDVAYWNPKYAENLEKLLLCKLPIKEIGDYEKNLTYGAIVTGKKDYSGKGLLLLNQGNIQFTGLDLNDVKEVKRDSPWDINRAKVKIGSIVLARSGMGGVGKNKITVIDKPLDAVVDSFVDILNLDSKLINLFYVVVFWKTYFGWLQIERLINGVGTLNISFDEIRGIKIPLFSNKIQENVESEYKKMSVYHDKAMEAKKKCDEMGYKKNIEVAENMLKKLITKTEAVIRGERKDVI